MNTLNKLLEDLKQKKAKYKSKNISYNIPSLWLNFDLNNPHTLVTIDPFDFFIEKINDILEGRVKSKGSISYNMFIRASLSFEHNLSSNAKNFNENLFKNSGTFLKSIAFLPYLSELNIGYIHILPVNSIGIDGRKGELGSPYAVRNHYKLDENLSEEVLDLSIEEQYKAFVEAVHLCGMKLIQEFVFRTASVDSDLTLTNPNWFYWIKNTLKIAKNKDESGYSAPHFSAKQLETIKNRVENKELTKLTQPDEKYRAYFTNTPIKTARVENKIIGVLQNLPKPKKTNETQIAPAFADWPPDDNQPIWSDVTYFKLYEHPDFNYIAYNTVRMYDNVLTMRENIVTELWEYIAGILPFYIKEYGIDGAMIDMGHSLPLELLEEILKRAKEQSPEFILWEENFNISKESAGVYDATLGYALFDSHNPDKLFELLKRIENKDIAISFFGTAENHNTPRAFHRISDRNYLIMIYAIYSFVNCTHYIHSGFELAEIDPINTGLQFTDEEIEYYQKVGLALFDYKCFNWLSSGIIKEIIAINKIVSEGLSKEREINISKLENGLFELMVSDKNLRFKIFYNHSSELIKLSEKIENIEYQNAIQVSETEIFFQAYSLLISKISTN